MTGRTIIIGASVAAVLVAGYFFFRTKYELKEMTQEDRQLLTTIKIE